MRAKPFLIGCFAVVAVIATVSIYLSATVDRAQRTIDAVLSPDGRFKAVRTTLTAGGAVPFCLDNIAVRLSIYPDNFDEHKNA
jgi:hypothetical protein